MDFTGYLGRVRYRLTAGGCLIAFIALSVFVRGFSQPSQSSRSPRRIARGAGAFPLLLRPSPLELGVLRPKQPARRSVVVQNTLPENITLERVDASCNCVEVAGLPVRLGPNHAEAIQVSFDPSADPEFVGALGVILTGYLTGGRVAFRTEVQFEVDARLIRQ
jgi:hypothetical protein